MFTKIESIYPIRLPGGRVVEVQLELDRDGNVELAFTEFTFGHELARYLMRDQLQGFELTLMLKETIPAELGLED